MKMKNLDLKLNEENIHYVLKNNFINRNRYISSFLKLINGLEENKIIALDGEWGSGKTWFVKSVEYLMNSESNNELNIVDKEIMNKVKDKYMTFYYNAWENDDAKSAMLSLIYKLIKGDLKMKANKKIIGLILAGGIMICTGFALGNAQYEDYLDSKENTKTEKIAAIKYNNIEIKIDMEVSPLLEKLGEPDHKETIEADEENSEESYSYTYDNMTIYAYLKDKKQYVADVSISGPGDASTANGIKVGASKDNVAKIYGKVTDENMASYEIDKNVIMFIFKDDSVTNISLSRGLSDEEL